MSGRQTSQLILKRLKLRRDLIERTGHGATTSWLPGDTAAERQARDDEAAGRRLWSDAHDFATEGLEALDRGAPDEALACLLAADDCLIGALEMRLRPDDLRQLAKPAQRRGRKKLA